MSQSLAAVSIHLVFSTKERRPFLRDPVLRQDMFGYLGGISKKLDCSADAVGGFVDHIHFLGQINRTESISDWVKELKRGSGLWMKRERDQFQFEWQSGYAAFSVSASNLVAVRNYIAHQEEHHRTRSFQEELRNLLSKHGVEWKEEYLWD